MVFAKWIEPKIFLTTKEEHSYVFFPKQDMYFDEEHHNYICKDDDGEWKRSQHVPTRFSTINIAVLPHVHIKEKTLFPNFQNEKHKHNTRFIIYLFPYDEFFLSKHPNRHKRDDEDDEFYFHEIKKNKPLKFVISIQFGENEMEWEDDHDDDHRKHKGHDDDEDDDHHDRDDHDHDEKKKKHDKEYDQHENKGGYRIEINLKNKKSHH